MIGTIGTQRENAVAPPDSTPNNSPLELPFPRQHGPLTQDMPLALRARRQTFQLDANVTYDQVVGSSVNCQWRTMVIKNYTSWYLYLVELQQYVTPWRYGEVIALPGNASVTFRWASPPGITQATFSGATPKGASGILLENDYQPDPGEAWQVV